VQSSTSARRIGVSAVGIGGTVLVHILIVLPLFIDLSLSAPHLPNRSGAGASAMASTQEPTMTVVFINEVEPAQRLAPLKPEELASRGVAPRDLPIVVLSPDASPAEDASSQEQQDDSALPEAKGDQTQHALLYGRYLVQVQARIERAWMRPRSAIGAARFSCRTQIQQDRRGAVVTIALDHCNGSERWQQSLLSAIRTASPLPAPPDPSVYADRLWLMFGSEGFQPSGSAQGFEPAARETFAAVDPSQATNHLADGLNANFGFRRKESPDVIHLTIIGSSTQVTFPTAPSSIH
jgi:hypothetical protein